MESLHGILINILAVLLLLSPVALVLSIFYYLVYKYPKTYTIINTTYEKNGIKFLITTKHYRRAHISRKRRHVFESIIEGEKILPNLFLDSHYKDKFLYATDNNIYDQNQRVSLEGDFDKYFTLYSPSGLEKEALAIITPDVMLILRDELHRSDIQTVGHLIVLTTNEKISEKELLSGLHNLLDKIARIYKYQSFDEQITHSKILVKKNSVDEAVKIRTVLVSTVTILYWIVFLFPGFIYTIFFFQIEMEEIQIKNFLLGLAVALSIGLVGAVLIYADEKKWIDLEELTK